MTGSNGRASTRRIAAHTEDGGWCVSTLRPLDARTPNAEQTCISREFVHIHAPERVAHVASPAWPKHLRVRRPAVSQCTNLWRQLLPPLGLCGRCGAAACLSIAAGPQHISGDGFGCELTAPPVRVGGGCTNHGACRARRAAVGPRGTTLFSSAALGEFAIGEFMQCSSAVSETAKVGSRVPGAGLVERGSAKIRSISAPISLLRSPFDLPLRSRRSEFDPNLLRIRKPSTGYRGTLDRAGPSAEA